MPLGPMDGPASVPMKTFVILAAIVIVLGGAYLVTAESPPDPEAQAVAEALALHPRARRVARDEEGADAHKKRATWRKLKKAGTPDPADSKQARKTLRGMIKEGCRDAG